MNILALIREDLQNARTHDPASRGDLENALVYSGLHAIWAYRVFHAMWQIPVPVSYTHLTLPTNREV